MWLLSEVQQGVCGCGCCAVPLLCRALPHAYLCTLTEGGVGAALEFRIKFYETILFMSSTIVCSPIHDAHFLSLQLYPAFFLVMQLHLNRVMLHWRWTCSEPSCFFCLLSSTSAAQYTPTYSPCKILSQCLANRTQAGRYNTTGLPSPGCARPTHSPQNTVLALKTEAGSQLPASQTELAGLAQLTRYKLWRWSSFECIM